jgi:4-hydroxybenzoate polyprenyltransferase
MKAWLQLFRVPNLLTVPGDPLAGFLIASGGQLDTRVVFAMLASLCLYAAGLAINDLADFAEDKQDRPKRPLPSGAISRPAAWIITGNLVIFGLGFSFAAGPNAALMGIGVILGVTLYNFLTKRIAIIGALNMGVCRGLSLLLGAAAAIAPDQRFLDTGTGLLDFNPLLSAIFTTTAFVSGQRFFIFAVGAALLIALYIAAVTNLARHETRPEYPKIARVLPLGTLLIGFVLLKQVTESLLRDQSPALWVVGIVLCAFNTSELMRIPPPPLPPRIGSYIRILPVLQASLCLLPSIPTGLHKTPASFLSAIALLASVPLHAWLGKKFYAS